MSVTQAFLKLRFALQGVRLERGVKSRVRLFAAAKVALDTLQKADAGLVHGDVKSLAAELAATLRTLRRGLPLQHAQTDCGGLKTGGTSGADHLGVKNTGRGHGAKRATGKTKGNCEREGAGSVAHAA